MENWRSLHLGICSTLSFSRWWQIFLYLTLMRMQNRLALILSHCWGGYPFLSLVHRRKIRADRFKTCSSVQLFDMVTFDICHLQSSCLRSTHTHTHTHSYTEKEKKTRHVISSFQFWVWPQSGHARRLSKQFVQLEKWSSSCRGAAFCSQHPGSGWQSSLTPAPRDLMAFSDPIPCTWFTYIQTKHSCA